MEDDIDDRPEQPGAGAGPNDEVSRPPRRDVAANNDPRPSGEVRIAAVEAGVAAGLVSASSEPAEPAEPEEASAPAVEMPDWSDPPTGQVPRVLLEASGEVDADDLTDPLLRGPSWREQSADWDDHSDLSFLVDDDPVASEAVAGEAVSDANPFEFAFDELDLADEQQPVEPEAPEPEWLDHGPSEDLELGPRSRRRRRRPSPRRRSEEPASPDAGPVRRGSGRNAVLATVTGVVLAGVALICFALGTVATEVLVAVIVTLAAGELFGSIRRAGHAPATLVGLVAVAALVVGAYARGVDATTVIIGLSVLVSALWYLLGVTDAPPLTNLAMTLLVICWVGLLGSFAGLLLAPATFPNRHGLAFLIGAIVITVAHDVGSYVVGATLGRRRFVSAISPHKTVEGLLGGTALAFIVGGLVVSRIHPFTVGAALGLAAIVAVLAPLGDLTESLIKRDLGVKDMGRILPAHGGIFDRVDALLFVLPGAYLLMRALNLG